MEFEFSDEQRQLREAVEGFATKEYSFDRLRAIKRSGAGWDPAVWRGLADLGVTALNVPASLGGLGYGPTETLALMDASGPSLLLEPILTSAVIATALLRQFEGSAPAAELLRAMAAGDRIAALAHFEPKSRFDTRWIETRATSAGGGFRLEGHKAVVAHAGIADVFLVCARSAGEAGEPQGLSLFVVPRETPGLTLTEYLTVDGQRAADIHMDGALVPETSRLGGEGDALAAIEAALDLGLAALCAEAVSIMQALIRATVEYLNTRQQFGQPIGRFQALQHRVADMTVHLEQARSMSYLAAMRCTSTDLRERRRALSAAKVVIAEAARFVGQQAVQLHGGMGMTDELKVSHWFKRLTAIEILFGDGDFHLQRFAASTGAADAD
ncbi:MAG: acyl-CoA dehydrogenase [Steroidobacteraceae bacterium]|jgi:alkylation response protein AidB-like acyl-CoA dehydrogenase